MRNENLEQDLGWAPSQYPQYNDFESGEWRIVEDDGALVGLIYTNYGSSAGVVWLTQTPTVEDMRKMFLTACASGMTARAAYAAVESKYSNNLRPVNTGTMNGVNDTFRGLMQRGN